MVFLLHVLHGKFSTVHLWSNERDFNVTFASKPFIKAFNWRSKCQIRRLHPNFSIYTHVVWRKMYSWMPRAKELFSHLNPWISHFLLLLDSFLHPRSSFKWDFVKRIRRLHLLNADNCHQNCGMKSLWSDNQLDHFERYLGLDYVFSS